jgi:glutaredoxin
MVAGIELYGASTCPHTSQLREQPEWRGISFREYDVEQDAEARTRLAALTGSRPAVPVLVEDGRVKEIGWRGRTCLIEVG